MDARLLLALGAAASVGLAGCNDRARAGGAAGICKPFTTAAAQTSGPAQTSIGTALPGAPGNVLPAAPAADPSASLDDCLHRWGYTLAASTDPANVVAEASLAACSQALAGWNQQSLTTAGPSGAVQAPSLLNGEQTNPLAEHYAFAQGRALFYVVQARAGHCAPPPAAKETARS